MEDTAWPVRGSGRLNSGSLKEPTSTSLDSVRTMTRVVGGRVGTARAVGGGEATFLAGARDRRACADEGLQQQGLARSQAAMSSAVQARAVCVGVRRVGEFLRCESAM